MLADGRLHLSGIARLAPLLTEANRETLLARAAYKSKRQIDELVAELSPKPDVTATMRKIPERRKKKPTSSSQLRPDRAAGPNSTRDQEKLPVDYGKEVMERYRKFGRSSSRIYEPSTVYHFGGKAVRAP
jgi:hypothetical protein